MKNGGFDPQIIIPLLFLTGFSLSLIWSTNPSLFSFQALFFLVGFFLFFLFSKIDYKIFESLSWPIYFFSLLLLTLTFFGPKIRGATRWIEIASLRIQPVEFIKPLLALSLARIVSLKKAQSSKSILFYFFVLLLPLLLIFFQPDLGNVIIIFALGLGIIFGGGLSPNFIFVFILGGILLAPFGWNLLKDYQKMRIFSFLNPSIDPQGTGYNSIQAMIAVGSGQIFGRGLGRGTQSHLRFLLEYHTDFIFASLVEELGFMGGILLLLTYFILLFRILRIAEREKDTFKRLFCLGVFVQLLLQIFINIGMNIGLMPITGITLPLVSYGGSSVLATLLSLGIVVNIGKEEALEPPLVIK